MSALTTNNLSIGYGDSALLSEINVNLKIGQLIGLVGQNGVGKSTFIRTISGIQKGLEGSVMIEDSLLNQINSKQLATEMAIVLTEKPTAQNLSALELISLGRHPYSNWLGKLSKNDVEAVESAVAQTEVEHLLNKRLYELSDGQLQKVMIARALAQETDIILLDEPTSHLDLRNKVEVLELLQRISRTGKAILISTHEITLAAKVCDFFWGMDFGKSIEVDTPADLFGSGRLAEILHLKKGVL